jgi:CBS domain-containing protein
MPRTTNVIGAPPLTLWAETAADLMMPNPMSICADATVREAVAALTDHGYSAAPVIDEAGRPLGVVSRADILVYDREKGARLGAAAYYELADLTIGSGEHLGAGFHVEAVDGTLVRDIMTPVVYSVAPGTPAPKVVEQMVELQVHRLYVVEEDGTLVGVISALDLLRHLRPEILAV